MLAADRNRRRRLSVALSVNVFYRVVLESLRQAQRAAGNRRVRIRIRRAALVVQRQLEA